ncbi:hypothetical protein VTN96DRAFT_9035 [Rasamsonia emersonii]
MDQSDPRSGLKVSFQLACPPPTGRHARLRIRPRLVFQLQQVSFTTRPIPVFNVLHLGVFPPRSQEFPVKKGLGSNDLIVVRCESYSHLETTRRGSVEEAPRGDTRSELVAVIYQGRGSVIYFKHGPSWEGTRLHDGSYDFVARDQNGLFWIVRWILRNKDEADTLNESNASRSAAESEEKRFTFSIIKPTVRRHVVIASMSRMSIHLDDRAFHSPGNLSLASSLPPPFHGSKGCTDGAVTFACADLR